MQILLSTTATLVQPNHLPSVLHIAAMREDQRTLHAIKEIYRLSKNSRSIVED